MGSKNDYPVMKECEQILKKFNIKHDVLIVSAHRTPERLFKFAKQAHKNYSVICAGAGRAAHLAGMCASLTKIPVIGVPIKDKRQMEFLPYSLFRKCRTESQWLQQLSMEHLMLDCLQFR